MKETHMKQRAMIVVVGIAFALLSAAPARGHHSGSTLFDGSTKTLKGTVNKWLWSNPHCLLTVDVKGDDGQVVSWLVEMQAPNTIYPAGYRINTFKPGDPVTVTVHAVTNGRPYARVVSVTLADGKTMGDGVGGRADTPAP
jgi:hypothetical protein